jgi:hypothetical protein
MSFDSGCNDVVLGCVAEDGDSMFSQNVGAYLGVYMTSQHIFIAVTTSISQSSCNLRLYYK